MQFLVLQVALSSIDLTGPISSYLLARQKFHHKKVQVTNASLETRNSRVPRYLLARLRRLRQCRPRRRRPPRHRLRRRSLRLRTHCPHHGLRHRPRLRLPSQSSRLHRPRHCKALSSIRASRIHRRPGPRRDLRLRSSLPDRKRQLHLLSRRRIRLQRLRRPLTRALFAPRLLPHRGAAHRLLPSRHPRRNRRARPQRLRSNRHRPLPDADPPHQHPGHQHFGQPRPQHRSRDLRRRLGTQSTMALLGSTNRRSNHRRPHLHHLLRCPTATHPRRDVP